MIKWRVVGNKVWGFALKRGAKKDTHYRRYDHSHSDKGGWNKSEHQSEFRRGKSLLIISVINIPLKNLNFLIEAGAVKVL
jgi:hypothetical protein